jgi:hypothetical protein
MEKLDVYYALIFDPVEIDSKNLPFELGHNIVIDRATPDEIQHIKHSLPYDPLFSPNLFSYFETDRIYDGNSRTEVHLPTEQWKYYVLRLAFENNNVIAELDAVFNIASAWCDVSSFYWSQGFMSWKPDVIFQNARYLSAWKRRIIAKENLNEIVDLLTLYRQVIGPPQAANDHMPNASGSLGRLHPEIRRAITMLSNLKGLTHSSDLLVLGLFAIIEMLITHNPKLEDRGDSITHQLKSKIPLLERRFDRRLQYADYFGGASIEKVWSALYKYRSSIAHGGELDFKNGLSILKSKDNADQFLFEVVRGMLRHILREPDLYKDIRAC